MRDYIVNEIRTMNKGKNDRSTQKGGRRLLRSWESSTRVDLRRFRRRHRGKPVHRLGAHVVENLAEAERVVLDERRREGLSVPKKAAEDSFVGK